MQSTSIPTTPCTIWTGAVQSRGYGSASNGKGGSMLAHRRAWEQQHGPIPDDLTVDHLCYTPRCINTEHMELVTRSENIRRAAARRREMRSEADGEFRCKSGHTVAGDNLRVYTTKQGTTRNVCKECARQGYRDWYHRQKAAKP